MIRKIVKWSFDLLQQVLVSTTVKYYKIDVNICDNFLNIVSHSHLLKTDSHDKKPVNWWRIQNSSIICGRRCWKFFFVYKSSWRTDFKKFLICLFIVSQVSFAKLLMKYFVEFNENWPINLKLLKCQLAAFYFRKFLVKKLLRDKLFALSKIVAIFLTLRLILSLSKSTDALKSSKQHSLHFILT